MNAPGDLEELKPGAWGFFFVPPFSKTLSCPQVSSLAPYSSGLVFIFLVYSSNNGQLPIPLGFLIGQTIARGPQIRYSTSMGHDGTSSSE